MGLQEVDQLRQPGCDTRMLLAGGPDVPCAHRGDQGHTRRNQQAHAPRAASQEGHHRGGGIDQRNQIAGGGGRTGNVAEDECRRDYHDAAAPEAHHQETALVLRVFRRRGTGERARRARIVPHRAHEATERYQHRDHGRTGEECTDGL